MEAEIVEPGVPINVGSGESISLNQLYRAMAQALGSEIEPRYGPPRAGDVRHSLASLERAEKLLDYRPEISWRAGLELTLDWYREAIGAST